MVGTCIVTAQLQAGLEFSHRLLLLCFSVISEKSGFSFFFLSNVFFLSRKIKSRLSGTGVVGEKISQTSQNVILVRMLVIKNF